MKNIFTTRRLCRAGVIAALYVALTYVFAPFAFGPFQIRPAEALCLLALVYPEAIPALTVGCALSNIVSNIGSIPVFDVVFGSLTTMLAAFVTYLVGKFIKNKPLKIILGGIPPVLFNAFVIPLLIVFVGGGSEGYDSVTVAYFTFVGSIALTQSVWVFGLGAPLHLAVDRLRKKGVRVFCD